MNGFFNLNSPVIKFLNLTADCAILTIVWLLTTICTLFVGLGASNTAIYFVMTRRIFDKENYILRDFFESFKRDFVKSTLAYLILLASFLLIGFNILILRDINFPQYLYVFLYSFQFFALLELSFISVFIFPLLSRFDLSFKQLVFNAFYISNRHFLTSLCCVMLFFIIIYIIFIFPPFLLISMGVYSLASSFLIVKVFKKYRPDLDSDDLNIKEI